MRISQYAAFSLESRTVPASRMTTLLRTEPDRLLVRGSRRTDPPVPVFHSWSLVCREPEMCVDDLVEALLARLEPMADRIRELVGTTDVEAHVGLVRDFDPVEDGAEEHHDPVISEEGDVIEILSGQHQLLGWHLSAESLAFIVSLPASLGADEYG